MYVIGLVVILKSRLQIQNLVEIINKMIAKRRKPATIFF